MRALPLFALALVLLPGCVSRPPQRAAVPQNYEQLRNELQALESFTYKGRLAAAVGQDGFNANIEWRQRGEASVIELRAPLGFGSAHVERNGGHISLTTSRGDRLENEAASIELQRRLGFDAPLDSLRYWVLGVPDPQKAAQEIFDDEGAALRGLEQDGWTVQYEGRRLTGGRLLPQRITIKKGNVRVRLISEVFVFADSFTR